MASTVAQHKTINPANAYLVRSTITRYNPTTNAFEPWTGLTTMVVGFYKDALGANGIAGLTNISMTQSSVVGTYYAVVSASSTAPLATLYNNELIYQIVSGGPSNEIKVVTPLLVTQPRYAQ
jgi:hypothetical protein